ncbi:nucleotidyltransferase domain-containing protein [Ignavibacterium album]|uniref:nucleotidyltransferase domain-containing protein n=1 Tax=Ignavibacterium album TaxID=591197 RepID=UPI0035B90870
MLSPLSKNIIKTLAYYDIFSYPLKVEEIYHNLPVNHCTAKDIQSELNLLCEKGLVYRINDFYLLQNNCEIVRKRIQGNKLCMKKMKSAFRMSKFISKFPYVRAIFLTGSISKGYMDKESDVDYMIITEPNRLWVSKLLLTIFKKIFLLNSRKVFCVNYYIDYNHLEIEEKNVFTATEIVTLIPVFGKKYYEEFYSKNIWIKEYFPNFPKRNNIMIDENRDLIQKTFERLLNNQVGEKIDNWAMKLFTIVTKKKFSYFSEKDFALAFKSSKYESKYHPKFFQKKVLVSFEEKINRLQHLMNVSLN